MIWRVAMTKTLKYWQKDLSPFYLIYLFSRKTDVCYFTSFCHFYLIQLAYHFRIIQPKIWDRPTNGSRWLLIGVPKPLWEETKEVSRSNSDQWSNARSSAEAVLLLKVSLSDWPS